MIEMFNLLCRLLHAVFFRTNTYKSESERGEGGGACWERDRKRKRRSDNVRCEDIVIVITANTS